MEWAAWRPLYLEIVRDFRYSLEADRESAILLERRVDPSKIPSFRTIADIIGERVSICGGADSLEVELGNLSVRGTVVSAGSATERLMVQGIIPDVVVTDLDGDVGRQIEANTKGSLVFVHAHGDNIDAIVENVPRFKGPIVPTVQCQPFGHVYNFGGFTDGDRAYFIAKHFGASVIALKGWDTSKVGRKDAVDPVVKKKKLSWAERLMSEF
ncbi:MAG: DUF115 domain-containing protein [Methanomassiliicoccales archaeon]|nr:DUF115 domain-containing protein [Methanomassiliicoccales archaeon]